MPSISDPPTLAREAARRARADARSSGAATPAPKGGRRRPGHPEPACAAAAHRPRCGVGHRLGAVCRVQPSAPARKCWRQRAPAHRRITRVLTRAVLPVHRDPLKSTRDPRRAHWGRPLPRAIRPCRSPGSRDSRGSWHLRHLHSVAAAPGPSRALRHDPRHARCHPLLLARPARVRRPARAGGSGPDRAWAAPGPARSPPAGTYHTARQAGSHVHFVGGRGRHRPSSGAPGSRSGTGGESA